MDRAILVLPTPEREREGGEKERRAVFLPPGGPVQHNIFPCTH